MAAEHFAQNLDILKNGVYGKDVRQAIYDMLAGHEEILTALENQSGGSGPSVASGGPICGMVLESHS